MAVGEGGLLIRDPAGLAVSLHDTDSGADILDLAAVGTGIHIDTAAHGAGDAVGKLQTAQVQTRSKNSGPAHGHTGHHTDAGVRNALHALQGILEHDGKISQSCIGCQHIGACAQNDRLHSVRRAELQQCGQLLLRLGEGGAVHGAADAEGSETAHGHIPLQLQIRQNIRNHIDKFSKIQHKRLRVYSLC